MHLQVQFKSVCYRIILNLSPLVVGGGGGLTLQFPEFTSQLKSIGTETSSLWSPVDAVFVYMEDVYSRR